MLEEIYSPNEEDFRYSEISDVDEPRYDLEGSDASTASCYEEIETPEGRLSESLRQWNPDFQIRFCVPRELNHREPTFSGRLGKEPTVRRTFSLESIVTQLSLLTCSMKEGETKEEKTESRRRRRKKKETPGPGKTPALTASKWVEYANKRRGVLDRMMTSQNAHASANFNMDNSVVYQVRGYDSAYDLMDEHEKSQLYNCSITRGLKMPMMKKSGSTTNILDITSDVQRRITSAGGKRFKRGSEIDFRKWKEDVARRKLSRAASQGSLGNKLNVSGNVQDERTYSRKPPVIKQKEEKVKLWQGDILERDLKREFTTKVKRRINSTNAALVRVTGVGESNRKQILVGAHEEFPKHIKEVYSRCPKMPQHIRLSPDLHHVITEDIKIRMVRPRYHAIRMTDLQLWDKSQKLDRKHRNLKVFNWLYSLKGEKFDMDIEPDIHDDPPDADFVFPAETMHVEACDDPNEKPMYERAASKFQERIKSASLSCQS